MQQQWSANDNYGFQALLECDERFGVGFASLLDATSRGALGDRDRALVAVGLSASVVHLDRDAVSFSIRKALEHGCERGEIIDVLKLTSLQAVHGYMLGLESLTDVLSAERTEKTAQSEGAESSARAQEVFVRFRGSWFDELATWRDLVPETLIDYARLFEGSPVQHLSPGMAELILGINNASPNHMFGVGVRNHLGRAIELGVPVDAVLEALGMTIAMGLHTFAASSSVLAAEDRRAT